jgi:uncharacterized membrane protein
MEQKKNKYDTNPLDPDVARRTDDVWGANRANTGRADAVSETEEMSGATRETDSTPNTQAHWDSGSEAPTRRYADNRGLPPSYPSVFVPPVYAPPSAQGQGIHSGASDSTPPPKPLAGGAQPLNQPPTSRRVANVNLPENIVLMLPYLPFPFVGAVVAAVLLFLVPRAEPRARFHASQGLALHLIVLAVSILTGTVEDFLSGSAHVMLSIASAAFSVMAFIFFVVSMIRVYKGEPHVVPPVADLAGWLNEKIEPRK